MTIAHLVIGGEVAGGQLVALQLARAAKARGDRVLVVAPERGAFVELLETEGFEVRVIALRRTFQIGAAMRLARLLRNARADVLHTHTQLAGNILGRVAGRVAGARVVSHLHIENYFRRNRAVAAVHRALDNATARLCARIVVVSESTRRALERQGYPPQRMEVVYNGVDVPAEEAANGVRARLEVPAGAPLVGCVGRLCAVKGQRELLEAAALLAPDLRVALVGADLEQGGAYETILRADAERLGIAGRVRFLGYRDDVETLLRAFDVLALPSWGEGLPLVLLEAMAAGVPVVATSVGGVPELVVDGVTGMLVEPRRPEALAEAIRSVLDDRGRAREMGSAGRERVRDSFSVEAMTRRVLAIYDEIGGRSAGTSNS